MQNSLCIYIYIYMIQSISGYLKQSPVGFKTDDDTSFILKEVNIGCSEEGACNVNVHPECTSMYVYTWAAGRPSGLYKGHTQLVRPSRPVHRQWPGPVL